MLKYQNKLGQVSAKSILFWLFAYDTTINVME